MIANSYPQLGWLAPQAEPVAQNVPEMTGVVAPSFDPQQLNAMSLDLDAVRQSIDRIATSMTAIQEQCRAAPTELPTVSSPIKSK